MIAQCKAGVTGNNHSIKCSSAEEIGIVGWKNNNRATNVTIKILIILPLAVQYQMFTHQQETTEKDVNC